MRLRIASDIHTEFFIVEEIEVQARLILPVMQHDHETVLILAGDIGSMHDPENLKEFMRVIAPRFARVLYVPGNHEYYGGNLDTTVLGIQDMLGGHENLFMSANGIEFIAGKNFLMSTLWTDFDKENPESMSEAQMHMNDYRMIGKGNRTAKPEDMLEMHKLYLKTLEANMEEGDVVITHHSPSLKSIPEEYLTNRVNGAYHSDLSELILDKKPSIWIHGHTHTACSYKIGDTQIICNPRGYGNQYKKNGYNNQLLIEV